MCIIVVVLLGGIGIYTLTRVPKFLLKDNKTFKLEYGKKFPYDAMEILNMKEARIILRLVIIRLQ